MTYEDYMNDLTSLNLLYEDKIITLEEFMNIKSRIVDLLSSLIL